MPESEDIEETWDALYRGTLVDLPPRLDIRVDTRPRMPQPPPNNAQLNNRVRAVAAVGFPAQNRLPSPPRSYVLATLPPSFWLLTRKMDIPAQQSALAVRAPAPRFHRRILREIQTPDCHHLLPSI